MVMTTKLAGFRCNQVAYHYDEDQKIIFMSDSSCLADKKQYLRTVFLLLRVEFVLKWL